MALFTNLPITALLFIILCSACCAVLGSFVLWKKLSFFGDALSHSSLFAVAIGYFFQLDQIFVLILFNILFSILVNLISKQKSFAIDSVVMITSYFFIACAILFNESFNKNFEFEEFIFGDIIATTRSHLLIISGLFLSIFLFTKFYLKKFLVIIVNPDIARVKNINSTLINFYFMLLLSLLIAFAIKITGVFLTTALIIVPCAMSRILSKNPAQMIINSVIISVTISIIATATALKLELSIAPTIIFMQSLLFFILLIFKNFFYAKI